MPKFNLYQSLHTTVIGPAGKPIEVQIRTREMHQRAEWGVAAHWAYKDGSPSADIDWLNRIIDWQAEVSDPAQFMQSLKTDLEQDEVFVFTPKGRVVTLPLGSTTVDFAYAVHTEVGHACIGAKVNGRLVLARPPAVERRHVRDLHVQGGDGRAVAGLAGLRRLAAGAQQDPAVVQPRAAPGHDRAGPRRARRGAPPGGPAGAADVGVGPAQGGHRRVQLRRPRRPAGGRSASTTCRGGRSPSASPGVSAAATTPSSCRRPCCGRGAHRTQADKVGVHVEGLDDVLVRLANCCTPGARRRDHRLRHPGPRGERPPRRLRQRGVADERPRDAG